jgi:hypothetical protein
LACIPVFKEVRRGPRFGSQGEARRTRRVEMPHCSRRAVGVGRAVVAAVVIVQFAGVARAAAGQNLSPKASSAEVAFVSDMDGNNEIYAVDPDSAGLRRLTRTPWDESGPAWSPDRSKLAFFVSKGDPSGDPFSDASEIWTISADGSNAKFLLGGLGGTPAHIAWAPTAGPLPSRFIDSGAKNPLR